MQLIEAAGADSYASPKPQEKQAEKKNYDKKTNNGKQSLAEYPGKIFKYVFHNTNVPNVSRMINREESMSSKIILSIIWVSITGYATGHHCRIFLVSILCFQGKIPVFLSPLISMIIQNHQNTETF